MFTLQERLGQWMNGLISDQDMRLAIELDRLEHQAIAVLACRAAVCKQNGRLWGKMDNQFDHGKELLSRASTRQELADWLNAMAEHVGVIKTPTNPTGYWATPENIG